MKKLLWLSLAGLCAASLTAADAKSTVQSAARKLADAPNYSWTTENKPEGGEARFQMSAEGKTEKGGFTQFVLSFGENRFESFRKGDKVALQREGQWQTLDEMDERTARMARRWQEMKLPAAEADELAGKAKELKAGEDGLYSGDLTEQAVKDIFARFRRGGQSGPAPEARNAKGWVKFWVKDGALTKYQFNTQGTITVGQDQREMEINRTTTVEIKDVGTTKITVPDEVKKKLS